MSKSEIVIIRTSREDGKETEVKLSHAISKMCDVLEDIESVTDALLSGEVLRNVSFCYQLKKTASQD